MSLFDRLVVTTLPFVPKFVVGRVASRYVAGETLDDAVRVIRGLNAQGAMATVDLLGEEVMAKETAVAATEMYLRILAAIREHSLDANVSIKPTQLGLDIDENLCRDNVDRLIEAAKPDGGFVRLDMEDRTTTDATLRVYRQLHEKHGSGDPAQGPRGWCGVVFQAYMRRALADIDDLPDEGANVRLCKGIYIEPREAAWKGFDVVRANFVACLEKLFRKNVYVGIATHDEYLVQRSVELIDRMGVPRDRVEFQMLLGVEPVLRKILLDEGHRLRVYVPFGRDWYLYSTRRLRENPAIAGHVMKAMLRREPAV